MKQPYGNALPAAPTRGDSCFRDDGTLHFCFTDGVWTQISGGGGAAAFTDLTDAPASYLGQGGNIVTVNPGETGLQFSPAGVGGTQRIEYGGACVAFGSSQTDISSGVFPVGVNRPAADLYDHPGEYFGKCKFDVYEVLYNTPPGTVANSWKGLSFAGAAALYAFIRANFVPGSGPDRIANDAWIRWYDVVDDNADIINKVYGFNMFYGMLRGVKHYQDTQKSCAFANWVNFPAWFTDLCNRGVGFPPGYVYSMGTEQNALWPSQTHAKMYGLPRPGFLTQPWAPGNRWTYESLLGIFIPLPFPGMEFQNFTGPGDHLAVWCTLDLRARASWSWWNETDSMKDLQWNVSHNYASTIVLYPMRQTSPVNSNHAVFVKPYGIDQVGVNWYDQATYDLYGVYTMKNHSPIIRKLTPEQGGPTNDLFWLPRMNWDIAQIYTAKRLTTKMAGKDPDFSVQFFLRDKVTSKISRPSSARVVLSQRHRNAPWKYEVKR